MGARPDDGVFLQPIGHWLARGADERMLAAGLGQTRIPKAGKRCDSDGYTAWHYWAQSPDPGKTFAAVAKAMADVDRDARSTRGEHCSFLLCLRGRADGLHAWLVNGGSLDSAPTLAGDTLWHALAWSDNGCVDVASKLIDGGDIDRLDEDFLCPAVIALHRSSGGSALRWLKLGANPNTVDHHGRSLLHHAAVYGDVGLYEDILNSGADDSIKDERGQTANDILRNNKSGRVDRVMLASHWRNRFFLKNMF